MKVAVVSYKKDLIQKELKKYNIKLDNKKPNVVICFGGEGTFLFGEQVYPGIPKLLIYRGSEQKKLNYNLSNIIRNLSKGKYKKEAIIKLEASANGKKLVAMNDINFHYKVPLAVRFDLYVDNRKVADNVIGDGAIISTSYGSNAYYKSITGKTFSKGIGIAFNNPMEKIKSIIVSDNSKIKIKVLRGPSLLAADCNSNVLQLKTGDIINIQKHGKKAILLNMGKIKIGK